MINNETNIEITIALLKKHNIKHVIISPGGTNAVFAKKIQNDPHFICYSVVDERSALYVAIGLYLQVKSIIAVLCTSAQATRNYVPGLTEAYYKRVPILAITMEKHPRFKYQEYMQAPDQTSLPRDSVKKSIELPMIADENDIVLSNRLINEAIIELTENGMGPVQLCIPWLDFPITKYNNPYRIIKTYNYNDEWNVELLSKKIMIVIGEHLPFDEKLTRSIEKFCEGHNSFVYANHLSNYNGKYAVKANLMLTCINVELFKKIAPDVLICIGGQTGDYPLYKLLSKNEVNEFEVWRVSDNHQIVDTYDKLTIQFNISERCFFEKLSEIDFENSDHSYYLTWNNLNNEIRRDLETPFSNLYIAQTFSKKALSNCIIQLSILNSLRVWSLFEFDNRIEFYSNVGAFGIDGGMSTLIGQSIATDKLCFMVIGDLAFYYDMNSLGIRHIKNNLRIVLINNNGGVEFKLNGQNRAEADKYISASNHFKNAKGWAETCGFKYYSARNKSDFNSLITIINNPSDQPILLEAFVTDIDEAKALNMIVDYNKNSFSSKKEIFSRKINDFKKKSKKDN